MLTLCLRSHDTREAQLMPQSGQIQPCYLMLCELKQRTGHSELLKKGHTPGTDLTGLL